MKAAGHCRVATRRGVGLVRGSPFHDTTITTVFVRTEQAAQCLLPVIKTTMV